MVGRADMSEDFQIQVTAFIGRAQATGAILDAFYRDRRATQSILDYWANTIYRASNQSLPARLAAFNPSLAPELSDAACPYQGLSTFDEERYEFFFGREALVNKMVQRLRSGQRLLVVVGASGSGKSSVVRAGLLHALKAHCRRAIRGRTPSWCRAPTQSQVCVGRLPWSGPDGRHCSGAAYGPCRRTSSRRSSRFVLMRL